MSMGQEEREFAHRLRSPPRCPWLTSEFPASCVQPPRIPPELEMHDGADGDFDGTHVMSNGMTRLPGTHTLNT